MIYIFAEEVTPRLRYITHELFTFMHGIEIKLCSSYDFFDTLPEGTARINYSARQCNNALNILPHTLLKQNGIAPVEIEVKFWEYFPVFFANGNDKNAEWPFDIFSAAFYLMSRFEEYLPHESDQHGRYRAQDSLAAKNHFLELPLIDMWMSTLIEKLCHLFPAAAIASQRHFRHIKTIDVDNVFAYRHKGPVINALRIASLWIKGQKEKAKERLKVVMRQKNDPYFNLEEMGEIHKSYTTDTVFFFHCGGWGHNDKSTIVPSRAYAKTKKKLSRVFSCGLHPSYRAAHCPTLLSLEKRAMETATNKKVTCCRSHYLLFNFPKDFQMIEKKGFTDDYTLGYSNRPGFRASTSLPFHFYDLLQERQTQLVLHPLAVMDKTLNADMNMTAEEALIYLKQMADTVKKTEGEFVTLFHNQNQTDEVETRWKGWKSMYMELMEYTSTLN